MLNVRTDKHEDINYMNAILYQMYQNDCDKNKNNIFLRQNNYRFYSGLYSDAHNSYLMCRLCLTN